MARGTARRGFAASPAVIPTISVPAYSVPAMTKVLATPLIESAKAPAVNDYFQLACWVDEKGEAYGCANT